MIKYSFLFNIFASRPNVESFKMFRNLKIVNIDSIFPVVYTETGINESFAKLGLKPRTKLLLKSIEQQTVLGSPSLELKIK